MEFKPFKLPKIKVDLKKTDPILDIDPSVDPKSDWHRKFAFLPIKIGDTYHWLCNVYRRREEYKHPYGFAKYWNYMPYNDLALIAQTSLEAAGEYHARCYDEDEPERKRKTRRGNFIFVGTIGTVLLASFWLAASSGMKAEKRAAEISAQIDTAKSLDELKHILKRIAEKQ